MTASATRPAVLGFGWVGAEKDVVFEPHGAVARTERARLSTRVSGEDVHGTPLYTGKLAFGSFGRRWEAVDAGGGPLLAVEAGDRRHTVRYADGRVASAGGRMFTTEWSLTDDAGGTLLYPTATTGPWTVAPDAWLVAQDGTLTLAQFVATVQLYQRMRRFQQSSFRAD